MANKFHKRRYVPINPDKYAGDPTCIIMRSSWETKFALWCDNNPHVVKWSSEETIVPYRCPTDGKVHRYFIDFRIQVKNKAGNLVTYLIEIKPAVQTRPPAIPTRKTQRFLTEVMTWGKNEAKWKAATEYAKDRGWEFKILTEYDLGIK